jgi:hypothetical protein
MDWKRSTAGEKKPRKRKPVKAQEKAKKGADSQPSGARIVSSVPIKKLQSRSQTKIQQTLKQ